MTRVTAPALALLLACNPDTKSDEIDGILLPDVDQVSWADQIDNSYLPMPVGARWSYTAETAEGTETGEVEVTDETRDIQGVTATVVYDVVYLDGVLIEETWDWYAQSTDGDVWYLGEDSCEYEDGACVDTHGSWEWGVGGALPGVVMWADPTVDGQPYFQEYLAGEAEDVGEVIGIDEAIEVAAGAYTGCVRTADTSHLDPAVQEEKVYCPGVGNVATEEPDADEELVSASGL